MKQIKPSLRLLVAVLLVTRLVFLLWRVLHLAGTADTSDFRYFLDLARLSDQGLYPYIHYWAEYPPVFPWLIIGAYKFSLAIASGTAAEAWFYGLLGVFLVACETGMLLLLYRLACLLGDRRSAWRAAALYVFLFVPAYLFTGWFDTLPTLCFLGGLYLLLTKRERLSAAAVGLGIASKLFPVLLVPIALCSLRGFKKQLAYVLVAGGVVAAFLVPFLIANPAMVVASVKTAFFRPSWETVWALLDRYYGYGVVAPLVEHVDPASAAWAVHESLLPWSLITSVFGCLFGLFYWRFYGTRDRSQVLAATAFTLTLLLLYSRGYSPQYLTWLAPILVLLYPNAQGALVLVLLGLLNLVELPIYFSLFPQVHALLIVSVVARTILLVVLAWGYLGRALLPQALPVSVERMRSERPNG